MTTQPGGKPGGLGLVGLSSSTTASTVGVTTQASSGAATMAASGTRGQASVSGSGNNNG